MARSFTRSSSEYCYVNTTAMQTENYTISAWFKPNNVTDLMGIFSIGDKDSTVGYAVMAAYGSSADGLLANNSVRSGGGSNVNTETSNTYTANTWHHGAVRAGATADTWEPILDGDIANKGSETNTADFGNANWDRWGIGGYVGDSTPTAFFDGAIAEVAIWSTDLSDAEIIALSKGYSPLFIRRSLLSYWPLGGPLARNDGDKDVVGSRHFTAVATPSTADHPPGIVYPSTGFVPRDLSAAAPAGADFPFRRYYSGLV